MNLLQRVEQAFLGRNRSLLLQGEIVDGCTSLFIE